MYKNSGPILISKIRGSRQLIPEKYLAKSGIDIYRQQNPLDIEPDEPNGIEALIESRVEQDRTNERLRTDIFRSETIDDELISTVKLPSGLVGTRTERLVPEGTTLVVNGLTTEGDQRNLGNGFLEQVVVRAPSLFPNRTARTSISDGVPEMFRMLIPLRELAATMPGAIDLTPELGPGEISRQEDEVDVFNFRRTQTTRLPPSLPQTFVFRRLGGERFGGAIMQESATLDDVPLPVQFGLGVTESESKPLGNGLFLSTTEKWDTAVSWPILNNKTWDEEIFNWKIEETQVVVPTYIPISGTYFVESTKAIDFTKTQRIRVTRQPTNLGEANAIITEKWHPYQFPGWLAATGFGYYVRRTHADLCRHTIKTWFEVSSTKPVIPVDEIIMDNPIISSLNDTTQLQYAGECLHDDLTTFGSLHWPATTPTSTEYAFGVLTGFTLNNIFSLNSPGTGYTVGNILFVSGDGGSVSLTVTTIGVAGSIRTYTPTIGYHGWAVGSWGPYTAAGGSGSGAMVNVSGIEIPNFDDTTKWIGNSKVIAADVVTTDIPNLWKIQTINVVMR